MRGSPCRIKTAGRVYSIHKEKAHKDDRRDSRKIARGLRNGELEAIYVPLRKTIENRMLYRARIAIVKDLRRCKQRIKAMLNFLGIGQPFIFSAPGTHWSRRCMDWLAGIKMEHDTGGYALKMLAGKAEELRKRLLDTNKEIRKLSCSEAYKDDYKLTGSIPGIALIPGMAFLTEIEDTNRFPGTDRFAAYVGLVPSCHSTGGHEHVGGITPRGQKQLRGMITGSAWIAAKIDPALHLAFCNLCKRMEANKAIVRIARKLLYFTRHGFVHWDYQKVGNSESVNFSIPIHIRCIRYQKTSG
ncbi:hypothetical protein FACS1894181_18830 [Bacteroidia bacterium]|nr:hypothetical protein FACS1894181_18830 [Bacteroidia bacterium]